jgi:hypothetical protein
VKKEHYSTFYKHFFVCDPGLGTKKFQEIQADYDNNPKPKMFIQKLQMLVYSTMNKEQNVSWLKQWNEFGL